MSFLKHVKRVDQWTCDIRTSGSARGIRVATKLGPNNEVLEMLEWWDRDEAGEEMAKEEQFLLVDIKEDRYSRVMTAPRAVIEWLMHGERLEKYGERLLEHPAVR